MNWRASPLTYAGAAKIREDRVMSERVRRSYVLFLDFIGFRLADAWTGRVEAATDCAARMAHLDAHPHNFKRISRVLASLGHLGFRRYKAPLLAALEREIKLGTLRTAAAALVHHWRPLVHDEGSEEYEARTLERAEDRVDGACFVLSRSVSLEDAMPHDVRDGLGPGGQATEGKLCSAIVPCRRSSSRPLFRQALCNTPRSTPPDQAQWCRACGLANIDRTVLCSRHTCRWH